MFGSSDHVSATILVDGFWLLIFLAASTYLAVPVGLDVVPIGGVRTNGDGEREEAYCLRGLASDRVANS